MSENSLIEFNTNTNELSLFNLSDEAFGNLLEKITDTTPNYLNALKNTLEIKQIKKILNSLNLNWKNIDWKKVSQINILEILRASIRQNNNATEDFYYWKKLLKKFILKPEAIEENPSFYIETLEKLNHSSVYLLIEMINFSESNFTLDKNTGYKLLELPDTINFNVSLELLAKNNLISISAASGGPVQGQNIVLPFKTLGWMKKHGTSVQHVYNINFNYQAKQIDNILKD